MKDIQEIVNNLEQKKVLMSQFEQLSESLLVSEIDQLESLVDQREEIIQQVNELDNQLERIPLYQKDMETIQNAIKNRMNRSDINSEYLPIFDKGQEIFAVVNRIAKMELLIASHLEDCRKDLEEKLKESNNLPKIRKYLDTIPNEIEDGFLLKSGSKKI